MTKYEGQTLKNKTLVMEECFFLNCVLNDCDVFYSGGDVEMVNTRMDNCRWHFRGEALKTIQALMTIGMLKPQQIPVPMPMNPAAKAN